MSKQYVQHKSGVGEKWEVCSRGAYGWNVYGSDDKLRVFYVPETEYSPCDPLDEWENVTGACKVDSYSNSVGQFYSILHLGGLQLISADGEPCSGDCNVMYKKYGYQIRKIDGLHHGPAFVVERKK